MPVHFKGSSEYKTHYLPLQSIKSSSFQPSPEQMAKPAGRETAVLGITMEPQMSRKKRTQGPPTSLSTDFNQYPETPSDDFALLGRNDKFVENVRYKTKSRSKSLTRESSPPKQQKLSKQDKENLAVPRTQPFKPAPKVDTSKFRATTAKDSSILQAPRKEEKDPPTPLAPRKEQKEPAGIAKELKQTKTVPKPQVRESREVKKSKDDNLNANKMEAVKKSTFKDKKIHNMNEFVQTDMEKGVVDSAPEAPSEYALKYKAGVAPARIRKKVSEYEKAFTWKDRVASSPLLAAEQIVYNSNPAVAPFKANFPKTSEYAAQFKQYKMVTPRESRDDEAVSAAVSSKKRSKVKRSKSTGAIRPTHAAGSNSLITPDNKRQTLESELQGTELQERVPAVHHGKMKRQKSEYASNFQSPTKFNVERGAWRGADPPHLQPTVEVAAEPKSAVTSDDDGKPLLSNWFAEVLELRRKAQEYRKRAQGTHFSREHLVQLMAQQNEFWDQASTARSTTSTLSALSLEPGMEARQRKREQEKVAKAENAENIKDKINTGADHAPSAEIRPARTPDDVSLLAHEGSDEEAGQPDTELESHQDVLKKTVAKRVSQRKQAWQDEDDDVGSEYTPVSVTSSDGRIPTPKMRQSKTYSKRHHFDLTTPVVGGSLLSSPPQSSTKPKRSGKKQVNPNISKSWCVPSGNLAEELSTARSSESFYPVAGQGTYDVRHGPISATPTFGSPSKDTHALRDDEASADIPLQTSFVHSPVKARTVIQDPSVPRAKSSKPSKFDLQPTINEGVGQTYNKPLSFGVDGGDFVPRVDQDDDDVLSVSARSVASSCSLASEVYERAQKRTKEFWGKDGIASR